MPTTPTPTTPTASATASGPFVLFAYDWNSSCSSDRSCIHTFPTLEEAEQAYKGEQDAAEVAVIREECLTVISRGFIDRSAMPRQIRWSRELAWVPESQDPPLVSASR
jgi:hypothetical protein